MAGPPFESDAYRTGGRRHCQASGSAIASASEPAATALTSGEILEAGGPPAGAQSLGELRRQALRLDGTRGRLVVVRDGHELHLELGLGRQQRVPDVRRAIVLRTADGADVHRLGRPAVPL